MIEKEPQLLSNREHGQLGIRINPQVGAGTIAAFSTAGATSKFGVGLEDHRDDLLQLYKQNPWLSMIHCHVGSQGVALELSVSTLLLLLVFCLFIFGSLLCETNDAVNREPNDYTASMFYYRQQASGKL